MAPPIFPSGAALLVQFILLFGTILPLHSGNARSITLNSINPPPVQCEPFTFSWTDGTPPFFVNLIERGGPPDQRHLGLTNDSFWTWSSADFPASTVVQAMVWGSDSESSGLSAAFVVQPGPDNECLSGPPDTPPTPSSTDPVTVHVPSVGVSSSSLDSAPPGSHISTSTARPSSQAAQSFTTPSGLALSTVPTNTATTTASTSSGGPAAVLNSTTRAPSGSRTRLSTGAAAGIAAATSAVATSLVLASFLHIKRRRRSRAPAAGADLSPARRGSRIRNSSSHGDTSTASSSDADRTHNGGRSKPETDEEACTRANSSLVARASSMMDTGAPDRAGDLVFRQAHRESVNGVVEAEKLLREMRSLNRNVNVNRPGGGRNGNGQTETDGAVIPEERRARPALEVEHHRRHEADGGVRLGGGRAGEVRADDSDVDQLSMSESDGSTLPPPYSSDFGED